MAAAAFSTVICERRKSSCGSYVCHIKTQVKKKLSFASEMGRIDQLYPLRSFITHEEGRCLLLITHLQSRSNKEHTQELIKGGGDKTHTLAMKEEKNVKEKK